jgi:hypothetical protein
MTKQSQKVKDWRQRTKERIILAMGGKCVCCGYDKCNWSLALHHLDPNEKDFGFGSIRANCKSWNKIVVELRKCVLVCHNCHGEIHHGLSKVPKECTMFDEDFANYKEMEKLEREKDPSRYHPCPFCKKPVPNYKKHCSKSCAASNKESPFGKTKIKWPTDETLAKMLKESNFSATARKLGVCDNSVRKRVKTRNIDL